MRTHAAKTSHAAALDPCISAGTTAPSPWSEPVMSRRAAPTPVCPMVLRCVWRSTRALALWVALPAALAACAGPTHPAAPVVTAELAPVSRPHASSTTSAVNAPSLAPAVVAGQYPLVPSSPSRGGSVLSGLLLLRGVAQRFAHPDGGSVVRVALTVTNTGPAPVTVVPAAFVLGASQPWLVGQHFAESALQPGASVAGVLAFRSSSAAPLGPDEVALSHLDATGTPGAELRMTATPLAMAASTVRALEGIAAAHARQSAQVPASTTPRVATELTIAVDHVAVLPSTPYERQPRLGVTLSVVNLTHGQLDFRPANLQLFADGVPPSSPTVPPSTGAQVSVASMAASTLTVTWALPAEPTHDFDVRLTYGPAGKFILDQVHHVTVLAPSSTAAPTANAAPALAPGKSAALVAAASGVTAPATLGRA